MPTPFDDINTIFYDLVEKDNTFFDYYGLSPVEAMNLAERRADSCLMQAATKLSIENATDADFTDFDAENRVFAEDFTYEEKYLLARLQYQQYLYRDFATLRAQSTLFTSAEQAVFSPANERKTFLSMYQVLADENANLVNAYLWKNRRSRTRRELTYEDL